MQVGFDSKGRLVRLSAVGGQLELPRCENLTKSYTKNGARLGPCSILIEYGIDESSPNLFYTTTADLRLWELPAWPGPDRGGRYFPAVSAEYPVSRRAMTSQGGPARWQQLRHWPG